MAEAADFLLIHFNGTAWKKIPARIAALKKYGKPIVCNEDDKTGDAGALPRRRASQRCVVGIDATRPSINFIRSSLTAPRTILPFTRH